jgi:excisionase family DNA binding protein
MSNTAPYLVADKHDPTVLELSVELCRHENTIRRYIAQGRITAYRIGPRQIRIARESIVNLFEPITPQTPQAPV